MQQQFEALARQYEPDEVMRVAWSSRTEQVIRFAVLTEIGPLEGKSILDAGCGIGDFYGYLRQQGWHGRYTGYDLVAANCQAATEKYGQDLFFPQDILETTAEQSFDYVLASGLFFLAAADWEAVVRQMMKHLFDLCKIGLGANFLSVYSPRKVTENLAYADPGFVMDVCAGLTTNFQIRHDYTAQGDDFTLFAYRR